MEPGQGKYNIESGERKAWRELAAADPRAVEEGSLASYLEDTGEYILDALGERYLISPSAKSVKNLSNPSRKPEHFMDLSIPIYMVNARPIPPSREMVKELEGGGFFFRGSHVLPLDRVAEKYRADKGLFLEAGMSMGGVPVKMGDAAFRVPVFPRVELAFVLWLEDDEFPARASLLFDSNAGRHMALDVVWAVSLLCCQRLLAFTSAGAG